MYRTVYVSLMIALAATVAVVIYLVASGQRELHPSYALLLAIFVLVVHGLVPLIRRWRNRERH